MQLDRLNRCAVTVLVPPTAQMLEPAPSRRFLWNEGEGEPECMRNEQTRHAVIPLFVVALFKLLQIISNRMEISID